MQTITFADADLDEFRISVAGRNIAVRCAKALVSWVDEQRYLGSDEPKQYGLILWPAAVALALEIGERADEFRGRRVLELGAGVGLPGIAAAAIGGHVTQTDRDESALELSAQNAAHNGLDVERRRLDWNAWPDDIEADWLVASDILYRTSLHVQLERIFRQMATAGARILIADPMRPASLRMLGEMEQRGWSVRMNKWTIGEGDAGRVVGTFELALS